MSEEVFYIKTSDGTTFGIYDLNINEDTNQIDFSYGSVEEDIISKGYGDEVQRLVTDVVTEAMMEYMGKGIK